MVIGKFLAKHFTWTSSVVLEKLVSNCYKGKPAHAKRRNTRKSALIRKNCIKTEI
jgi:hypothetical protein